MENTNIFSQISDEFLSEINNIFELKDNFRYGRADKSATEISKEIKNSFETRKLILEVVNKSKLIRRNHEEEMQKENPDYSIDHNWEENILEKHYDYKIV
jgi:hypothetical protein